MAGISPGWLVFGRLALAALLLLPMAAWRGGLGGGGRRDWGFLVLIAFLGNVLPFWLIAWGQRGIDSGLSGILMAVMPLAVIALAHVFVPGEMLTRRRLAGFALGFVGVAVLLGPAALHGPTPPPTPGTPGTLAAMLSVLGGALCYAVSTILTRLRPARDALSSAALVTLTAALMTVPIATIWEPLPSLAPTWAELAALAVLGVFSTATAAVVYFRLIASTGPSFTSQLNYLIPLWALGLGILFLGESPSVHHLYALGLILAGVLVAASGQRVRAGA